jgi:hypothetical protein
MRALYLLLSLVMASRQLLGSTVNRESTYESYGKGPCRGNGGASDKINSKHSTDAAFIAAATGNAACKEHCDSLDGSVNAGNTPIVCIGYAWGAGGSLGCVIYGPGVSGHCSKPTATYFNHKAPDAELTYNVDTQAKCEGLGTCSVDGNWKFAMAGRDQPGPKELCETAGGTWTSAAGTWTGPDSSTVNWMGDSRSTVHIHNNGPIGGSEFECNDNHAHDHQGQCVSATKASCTTADHATTAPTADTCTDTDCTFVAAPSMEKVVVAHAPSTLTELCAFKGKYNPPMSGACRSNDDVSGPGVGTVSSASMYGKMGNGCSFECTAGGSCTAKQAACAAGGNSYATSCDKKTEADCEEMCNQLNIQKPGQCSGFHTGATVTGMCTVMGSFVESDVPLGTGMAENNKGQLSCMHFWGAADGADGKPLTGVTSTKANQEYLCYPACGLAGLPVCAADDPCAEDVETTTAPDSNAGVIVVAAIALLIA